MASNAKFEVGQKLWFVPGNGVSDPHWVEITKVGRIWLAAGIPERSYWKIRLDMETLKTNREHSHTVGQCYLNQEAYEDHARLCNAYLDLSKGTGRKPCDGVTISDVWEAARLLKIKLNDFEFEKSE